MYRHSAQIFLPTQNSLSSPESTSDSESDIIEALSKKRRQLDDEIANFKAAKDKEFRDFERELRLKKKRDRANGGPAGRGTATPTATSSSVLSLLASTVKQHPAGDRCTGNRSVDGDTGSPGQRKSKPPPLSKATLSLERLNINGETTLPLTMLTTPPTPNSWTRSMSRSPLHASRVLTPPRSSLPGMKQPQPLTPTFDQPDSFAGVFTPAYLPLLESRHDSQPQSLFVTSPLPIAPQHEEMKPLHVPPEPQSPSQPQPHGQNTDCQPSQSLPEESGPPTITAMKRSRTAPLLTRAASLPSALRTVRGSSVGRKRKHVTFQLADSAIVEPSSSYEEILSPSLTPMSSNPTPEASDETARDVSYPHDDEEVTVVTDRRDHDDPISPIEQVAPPRSLNEMSRSRGSPLPSPTMRGREGKGSPMINAVESGFSGGLQEADDGGSGIGFFELDEELAGPGMHEVRPFELADEAIDEDGETEGDVGGVRDAGGARAIKEYGSTGFTGAGSLPIDIVRPTGSWTGH